MNHDKEFDQLIASAEQFVKDNPFAPGVAFDLPSLLAGAKVGVPEDALLFGLLMGSIKLEQLTTEFVALHTLAHLLSDKEDELCSVTGGLMAAQDLLHLAIEALVYKGGYLSKDS